MRAFSEEEFPVTIVRPSLTYDSNFPVAIGSAGYTIADRLKRVGQSLFMEMAPPYG